MGNSKRRSSRKETDRAPLEKKPGRRGTPATHPLSPETSPASIPRGIEVLVKKASVDPAFKELLIEKRADAAREIDLKLDSAERMILTNLPKEHLEGVIARTKVNWKHRAAFLGRTAAVMLTALGTITLPTGCGKGIDPDRDYVLKKELEAPADDESGDDSET
jgi:hypothetical protein